MGRVLLVAVVGSSALLLCCGAFGANEPLQAGAADGAADDAAFDGGSESGGQSITDGAGADADAPGVDVDLPCALVLDDDFERPTALDMTRWDDLQASAGSFVDIDTTTRGTGVNSLRIDLSATGSHGYLVKNIGMRRQVRLRFMMRVSTSGARPLIMNTIEVPEEAVFFGFVVDASGSVVFREHYVESGTIPKDADHMLPPVVAGWHAYAVDLDFQANTVRVMVDGALANLPKLLASSVGPGALVTVRAGVSSVLAPGVSAIPIVWTDAVRVCQDP